MTTCPWCKAAIPGDWHECAERDFWLDIEDSNFDYDGPMFHDLDAVVAELGIEE